MGEYTSGSFSNITDLSSRVFINDFFINSFYILWTSFWYIPSFIVTLLLLFILKSSTESRPAVLIILLFLWQTLLMHYQNLNPHLYLNDVLGEHFNILLSNSINKFHPALFYISLLLITISHPNSLFLPQLNYSTKRSFKELTYFTNTSTRVIIFTLFLGSWWALQEGSWGGWWNWDPSEVFGLVIMLIHLNTLHRKLSSHNYTSTLYYTNLLWKYTLLVYVFIQFNFDLVSHNFGTRVDQFIDSSHNFLILLILLSVLLSLNYVRYMQPIISKVVMLSTLLHKYKVSWNVLLYTFILFILVSSFTLLINDFCWKVLQVNIFNSTKLTYYFTPILITLLLTRLWNPFLAGPVIYTLLNNILVIPILFIIYVRPTLSAVFHVSILTVLLSMCVEYNQNLSLWDLVPENASMQYGMLVSDLFGTTISLNNFFVECAKPNLLNNSIPECVWNIVWSSSSPENHNFGHPNTSYYLSQVLLSGSTLSQYLIMVVDLAVASTSILLLPLTYLFTQFVNRTKIIIL